MASMFTRDFPSYTELFLPQRHRGTEEVRTFDFANFLAHPCSAISLRLLLVPVPDYRCLAVGDLEAEADAVALGAGSAASDDRHHLTTGLSGGDHAGAQQGSLDTSSAQLRKRARSAKSEDVVLAGDATGGPGDRNAIHGRQEGESLRKVKQRREHVGEAVRRRLLVAE